MSAQGSESFLEKARLQAAKRPKSQRSKVDILLEELSEEPDLAKDVETALKDLSISASNLSIVMKEFNFNISDSSIKRWRASNVN